MSDACLMIMWYATDSTVIVQILLTLVVAALIYSASSYLGCVTAGGSTGSPMPNLISQFWQIAVLAILAMTTFLLVRFGL